MQNILQATFLRRVNCRANDIPWPPRSCDLTLLNFFLWGRIMDKVYSKQCFTFVQLCQLIRREINKIPGHLCEQILRAVTDLVNCRAVNSVKLYLNLNFTAYFHYPYAFFTIKFYTRIIEETNVLRYFWRTL